MLLIFDEYSRTANELSFITKVCTIFLTSGLYTFKFNWLKPPVMPPSIMEVVPQGCPGEISSILGFGVDLIKIIFQVERSATYFIK